MAHEHTLHSARPTVSLRAAIQVLVIAGARKDSCWLDRPQQLNTAKPSSLPLTHSAEPHRPEPLPECRPQVSSAAASILSLPTEIITAVLQNVAARKDLKLVRLTCKHLSSIAAARLFAEVTVVPHEDSFEQLLKLSDHSTLRKHVRSLIYDTRTMLEPEDVQLEINADPVLRLYWEGPSKRVRLRSFLKYHDEHTFRTVERTEQEMRYLLRLFESLPSLRAIKLRNTKGYDIERVGLPRFYDRMSKQMGEHHSKYFNSMVRTTHRTRSVLLCAFASELQLDHLQLEDLDWEELFSFADVRAESRYFKVLTRTLSARLPDRYACKRAAPSLDWAKILSRAADCVRHVKSFDLRFGNRDSWSENSEASSVILIPGLLPHLVPTVRTLRLEGFVAAADDLVNSILGLSPTLTSLTIVHARLLKEAGRPRACWVDVIQRLQRGLRLHKACVEGALSNGGRHYWYASTSAQLEMQARGERSLKSQIEDFLVQGGPCPLDRAVFPRLPADLREQPLWRGDESFFLCKVSCHIDDDDT